MSVHRASTVAGLRLLPAAAAGTAALVVAFAAAVPGQASAAWPADQPIRLVVPQAAGGTNDTVARLIGTELSKRLGQSVVVENKPGAAGAIGMQMTAQAQPDGYTLAIASDSATVLNALRPDLPWSFARNLVGVAMVGDQPVGIAVSAKSPYRDLPQLIAAAKAAPGTIAYGTSGLGSSQHLVGEWFAKLAGIEMIHVPYKGGGQAVSDLAGGQVPAAVLGSAPLVGQQKAGLVRIVAVTSPKRSEALPSVPTLTEAGFPQIAITQWVGIVAPRGTPAAIATRLSDEIGQILAQPAVKQKLRDSGLDARFMPSAPFDAFLKDSVETWKTLSATLNIRLN